MSVAEAESESVSVVTQFRQGETPRAFQASFAGLLYHSYTQDELPFPQVAVCCGDGVTVGVPAVLMAAICPVFRYVGAEVQMDGAEPGVCLIVPDLNLEEIALFLRKAFEMSELEDQVVLSPLEPHEQEALSKAMSILCPPVKCVDDVVNSALLLLDGGEWSQISGSVDLAKTVTSSSSQQQQQRQQGEDEKENVKPRVGRKRKSEALHTPAEPYVKLEVLETPRNKANYGLRNKIRRKQFSDQVTDISDEDEERDVGKKARRSSPEPESDEYEPGQADLEPDVEDEEEEDLDDDFDNEEEDGLKPRDDNNATLAVNLDPEAAELEDLPTAPVSVSESGQVEVVSQQDNKDLSKVQIAGRLVSVLPDEEEDLSAFVKDSSKKPAGNPRSLLKAPATETVFCSACRSRFDSLAELRHHVAGEHAEAESRLFSLPKEHPHRNCARSAALMKSYRLLLASDASLKLSDVCFPCPFCRRRFPGQLGGLSNHLMNDHRHAAVSGDLGAGDESQPGAMRVADEAALRCDFCSSSDFPSADALNAHLSECASNDSGHSPGLCCRLCGKTFSGGGELRGHLLRHGRRQLAQARRFWCALCGVACASQAGLDRHVDKAHGDADRDEDFVLHKDCERCAALFDSYMDNKMSGRIAVREMAFKCPHCCFVVYANQKHAPRFLYHHVNKFHADPAVNDFGLGPDGDASAFRVLSKSDPDVLRCDFCGHRSTFRCNHNAHLATCKANTVPCRPGYMCDACGFVAGTARHLRDHLETHNDAAAFSCELCAYTGRSERYLKQHVRKVHSAGPGPRRGRPRRPRAAAPENDEEEEQRCDKCGKQFRRGAPLNRHRKRCGAGAGAGAAGGQQRRVKCPDCAQEFKRNEDMQAHALIHLGQVSCPIHNILFKQETELFQHVNQAEPGARYPKLQCCMCDASFKHMCLFMKHIRRHLNISPYRCGICGKNVNTYASLQIHQRRMHTDAPPAPVAPRTFHCEECGKSFSTKGHLKEHVLGIHDRSEVFKCPVCPKVFNTAKRMKKHLFNTHKDVADTYRNSYRVETFTDSALKLDIRHMDQAAGDQQAAEHQNMATLE